jgi:hypothetical protein
LDFGWLASWIAFQGASLTVLAAYICSAIATDLFRLRAK